MSSTKTCSFDQPSDIISSESLTPSNSINTSNSFISFCLEISLIFHLELAEQFSEYDDDDGRSSRTYQNVNDEECFNQLHQELCSTCQNTFFFENYRTVSLFSKYNKLR